MREIQRVKQHDEIVQDALRLKREEEARITEAKAVAQLVRGDLREAAAK